jgi:hypothetical protein
MSVSLIAGRVISGERCAEDNAHAASCVPSKAMASWPFHDRQAK